MTFLGYESLYYERVLFMGFAVASAILFTMQILYFQELKIIPVHLLPLLSFSMCFENLCLFRQNDLSVHSDAAQAAYFFQALIVPLFIVIVFEVPFRLHEARLAHFGCIPFEQGTDMPHFAATAALWMVRLFAVGLFIMNIIVNYNFVPDQQELAGRGGYRSLAHHHRSLQLWLALIPPMVLSALSLLMSNFLYK
jgi:hypothetical protein